MKLFPKKPNKQLVPKYLKQIPIKKRPAFKTGLIQTVFSTIQLLRDLVEVVSYRVPSHGPRVGSSLFARSCRARKHCEVHKQHLDKQV